MKEDDNNCFFFVQAEDGIRDLYVTGVQTCALPIWSHQWRTALLARLGPGSRRRPCRRSGNLATGAPRTGIFSQRTAGQLFAHWRSRSDQYGPRRQSRRVGSVGTGHRRESDRERRDSWSHSDRDPRARGRADGRARPGGRCLRKTAFDTVRGPTAPKRTAHSSATPARSHVRSAPKGCAFPKTLRGKAVMNLFNFFAELKQRNVYKVGIAYALVGWLLMQIASQIFPFFEIPNWAVRLVVLLLMIGFPVALILAWAFDLTPEGIKRAADVNLSKSIAPKSRNLTAIARGARKEAVPFANTHWSVVLEAESESPAGKEALEKLCRIYWRPIYGFVRRQGVQPEEAKDLTQGFFALLLERRDLDTVRKQKGRLRSYLLTSVKQLLSNRRCRAMAIKWGEGQRLIPLEAFRERERAGFEPTDTASADHVYERRWALTVLDQVLVRLGDEYRAAGKLSLFDQLQKSLAIEPNHPSQADTAHEFGMKKTAVKQAFHQLRQRYRQLLREEVAHTVMVPGDIEDELRHLIAVLRAYPIRSYSHALEYNSA